MHCQLHTGARQQAFKSSLLSHQLINKELSLSHEVIGRSFISVPPYISHPHTIFFMSYAFDRRHRLHLNVNCIQMSGVISTDSAKIEEL